MTTLWTAPREWITSEPITEDKLNDISNDLLFLLNPPFGQVTVRGTRSNVTTTSTSFVAIDSIYSVTIELSAVRDLTVDLNGVASHSANSGVINLDVLVDGTTYLSSLTSTPLARGLFTMQWGVGTYVLPIKAEITVPAGTFTAGVHTFQPVWCVGSGTGTWYEASGYFSQFHVGEN